MKKLSMVALLVLTTAVCVDTVVMASGKVKAENRCACNKPKPKK